MSSPSAWKPVKEDTSAWKPVAEAPAPKQGFVSAFWEGIGGKALMDIMGGASRDPALAQKSIDTLKGLAHGLTNEGPRIMQQLDSAGEAIRKGDWGMAAHHAAGAAPLIGAAVQNAGVELERGDTAAAAGHTAALFAPFIAGKAPAVARAAADTDAGAAAIGAAKGAGKSLIETKPLTVKGIEIPVPTTVASAAAGGQAASMMGLPRTVGTVAGAAAPVIRGAVKGWKQAIAERAAQKAATANDAALAADAAKIPPDVMADLTRDGEVPGNSGNSQAVPQGQPIPQPRPRSEDLAALERLKQDQATHVPVQQPKLLGPGPQVTQMPAAPDPSGVRSVPLEQTGMVLQSKPTPGMPAAEQPTMAQQLQASATPQVAGVEPNPTAPQDPVQAPEVAAPVIDPQTSQFHANGEPKSAAFRGEAKIAKHTTDKATRWADALESSEIPPADLLKIKPGRLSDTQLQMKDAEPRWDNVLDHLIATGKLKPGETVPKTSLGQIIAELDKRAKAKTKTATVKESSPVQSPKSARDMNWAALAKQAGLSEKATRAEIEQAMAAELEKNAMAATAGNGK